MEPTMPHTDVWRSDPERGAAEHPSHNATPSPLADARDGAPGDPIDQAVGISRLRLNVQAFIGLFIFGWLMKMNYDDLDEPGFGWIFLIAMAVLFAVGRQGSPGAFLLMPVVYVACWVHTNLLLTAKRAHAREALGVSAGG